MDLCFDDAFLAGHWSSMSRPRSTPTQQECGQGSHCHRRNRGCRFRHPARPRTSLGVAGGGAGDEKRVTKSPHRNRITTPESRVKMLLAQTAPVPPKWRWWRDPDSPWDQVDSKDVVHVARGFFHVPVQPSADLIKLIFSFLDLDAFAIALTVSRAFHETLTPIRIAKTPNRLRPPGVWTGRGWHKQIIKTVCSWCRFHDPSPHGCGWLASKRLLLLCCPNPRCRKILKTLEPKVRFMSWETLK